MIIPDRISIREIGAPNKRSKDFSRVSIGNITGLIAVAVKNEVIETMPTKIWLRVICLPKIHDNTMKKGNINPKIRTGPFLTYKVIFFLVNIQMFFREARFFSKFTLHPPLYF
jgi:hypothetical protein